MKRLLLFLLSISTLTLQSCKEGPLTGGWWWISLFFIVLIPAFLFYQGTQSVKRPRTWDDVVNGQPVRRSDSSPRSWAKEPTSIMGWVILAIGVALTIGRLIFFK
jgi:hypothetical protein